MTQDNQRILSWYENQKKKDQKEVELAKKKFIEEIKMIGKNELFKEPKKLSLWQKLKIMILGK
jgi:hypothetical protein